jgi:hypothetical protein
MLTTRQPKPSAVDLTLVQTKQIRISVRKRKHSTDSTKHSKYEYYYTYYQIPPTYTHPHITKQVKTTTIVLFPTLKEFLGGSLFKDDEVK